MIYNIRNAVRKFVGVKTEYKLRRIMSSPFVSNSLSNKCCVHASARKAGSQFIRLVITDPRIVAAEKLKPYFFGNEYSESLNEVRSENRILISSYYGNLEELQQKLPSHNLRLLYVGREPLDCFRSWLRSTMFSHPNGDKVIEIRNQLNSAKSAEEKINILIDNYSSNDKLLFDWLKSTEDESVKLIKFESIKRSEFNIVAPIIKDAFAFSTSSENISNMLAQYTRLLKSSGGKYNSEKEYNYPTENFEQNCLREFKSRYSSTIELYSHL